MKSKNEVKSNSKAVGKMLDGSIKAFKQATRDAEREAMKAAQQDAAAGRKAVASKMILDAKKAMKAEIEAGRQKAAEAKTTEVAKEAFAAALLKPKASKRKKTTPTVQQTASALFQEIETLVKGAGPLVVKVPEAPVVEEQAPVVEAPVAKVVAEKTAEGPLTLRLYAKGHFWFGKKQTALLQGLPYVKVAVDGKQVTLTPTKSAKDAVEVKFSHGSPQIGVGKLLGEWSKATQDLAITMVGDAIQVVVL